jgi:putative ABC transport system substrate-binding protein
VITRRRILRTGCISLLVVHRFSYGQRAAAAIPRIGWITSGSQAGNPHLRAAFMQGMRDLGWLEGKNVEYRFVYADNDVGRLDALARELVGQKVDVILVNNGQSARAAQQATKTIPIVMAGVSNAAGAGFVVSLAKPGGNISGFASQQDEVLGKLIGILHEVAPGARRIAILMNENNPTHAAYWAGAQSACAALDLVALRVVASTSAQFGAAIEQIVRQRSQAVVVTSDTVYFSERAKLQELMQTTRLPTAYGLRDYVVAGGLISYGYDIVAVHRSAAKYVDKILKGARPADLPVEQATKFEMVINLETAKSLGITISKDMLMRADEVIE